MPPSARRRSAAFSETIENCRKIICRNLADGNILFFRCFAPAEAGPGVAIRHRNSVEKVKIAHEIQEYFAQLLRFWEMINENELKRWQGGTHFMDLAKLVSFVSIADTHNFTAASKRLFISQPSLSRHISELECELGVRLFIRTKNLVELTPEGATLLPIAKEIIEKKEKFLEVAQSLATSGSGHLSIGYSGYWEFQYLTEVINKFSTQFPFVNFSFTREHHGRLNQKLFNEECDIILTLKESDFQSYESQSIGWKLIAKAPFVAVMSSRHSLAGRPSVTLAEIANEAIIPISGTQDSILNTMIFKKIQEVNPAPNYFPFPPQNSYDLALLVSANKGIAITTSWLEYSKIAGVFFCPIEDELPHAEFGVAYRTDKRNPVMAAFLQIINQISFNI